MSWKLNIDGPWGLSGRWEIEMDLVPRLSYPTVTTASIASSVNAVTTNKSLEVKDLVWKSYEAQLEMFQNAWFQPKKIIEIRGGKMVTYLTPAGNIILYNHSWDELIHFSWKAHQVFIKPISNHTWWLVLWFKIHDSDNKWSYYTVSDTNDWWIEMQIFMNNNPDNRFDTVEELDSALEAMYQS